jgi:protein-S-isoprenylcysteine O-methyltransferase Ste14
MTAMHDDGRRSRAVRDHGPGVRVPPPVQVGLVLLAGWGLGRLLPLPLAAQFPWAGALVITGGLCLAAWAVLVMVRAGTDPRPDTADATLVEAGPFRCSRNPVYLGFVLVAAGIALRWGDLWGWLSAAASLVLLDRRVIPREEAYLAARFGRAYGAYCARVRRWL